MCWHNFKSNFKSVATLFNPLKPRKTMKVLLFVDGPHVPNETSLLLLVSKLRPFVLILRVAVKIKSGEGATNCKGVKNNTNFGQSTGIQEKLDTTCT